MDKHSTLLRAFVNYECKKFYNIGPRSESFSFIPGLRLEEAVSSSEDLSRIQPQLRLAGENTRAGIHKVRLE